MKTVNGCTLLIVTRLSVMTGSFQRRLLAASETSAMVSVTPCAGEAQRTSVQAAIWLAAWIWSGTESMTMPKLVSVS